MPLSADHHCSPVRVELLVTLRECRVDLPVVFLTGYGFTAQENLAFETGAVDFIDKAGALKSWPGDRAPVDPGLQISALRRSQRRLVGWLETSSRLSA